MEKYTTFKNIDKSDIVAFSGLSKEVKTSVVHSSIRVPLQITTFGITYPDPEYGIERVSAGCFVFEYVLSGKGYVINNGKKYVVKGGDAYIIHPHDTCKYYSDPDDPYMKYWINFSSNLFFDIMNAYGIHQQTVFENANLKEDFEKFFELDGDPCFNEHIYPRASAIIFEMLMKLAEKNREVRRVSDLAHEIKFMLSTSVKKPFSLETLTEKFFLSESQIIREFKKYYHVTPYKYLLNLRIDYAKNLLDNSDMTVKEIAELLTFSNEYYFSNYFKQRVGVSPKNYRKEKRNS